VNLTIDDLLSVSHLSAHGLNEIGGTKTFREVSTDSRTTKRGDLFVALRGERYDGHTFLAQIEKEGAVAAIVDKKWLKANPKSRLKLPMIVVESTLDAYGELARHYRRKFSIPILAIAGSNGKTTTKELIAHVLSSVLGVLKTEANYNNQVGVPRMLFQLRDGHDIAVLELGTNHPGEIDWLVNVAEPTHALITNIGREHLEFFENVKGVAKEECSLFEWTCDRHGMAFVNLEDKFLAPYAAKFVDRVKTFSTHAAANVTAHTTGFSKDGRLELRVTAEGKSFQLRSYIVADYAPSLIASAVAVGLSFKLRRAEIKQAIEHFHPHDKRLEVQRLANGVTVINDAYNANPDSMESAFRTLQSYPAAGKKYVIIGDMFELGEAAPKEHRALGKTLSETPFAHLYFLGQAMKAAYATYQRNAKRPERAMHFLHKHELAEKLREIVAEGDVLLVKGSRGMKMEELIEQLR
jgi:UDP-N-acetylmuramoyl-tripeptide--D-alanyl-D-alanine ligase